MVAYSSPSSIIMLWAYTSSKHKNKILTRGNFVKSCSNFQFFLPRVWPALASFFGTVDVPTENMYSCVYGVCYHTLVMVSTTSVDVAYELTTPVNL